MLDLTKPVRTKNGHMPCTIVGKKLDGTLILEDAEGFVFFRVADAIENISEPKVASMIVELVTFENGDCQIAVSYGVPKSMPGAKITYTEGAENPWAIEGVK